MRRTAKATLRTILMLTALLLLCALSARAATVETGANKDITEQALTVTDGAGKLLGTYDTLKAAFDYLNGIESPDTATPYAVTVNESIDIAEAGTTLDIKDAAAKVTLKSADGAAKILTRASALKGNLIEVKSGQLTIQNLALSGAKAENVTGSLVTIDGGVLTLEADAVLKDNLSTMTGGGVYVNNGGKLYMRAGSEISGNNNGGVYATSYSEFEMSGGTIKGNTAESGKGCVDIVGSSTFTMSDGEISGSDGRGVCIRSSTFTMSGGKITDNSRGVSVDNDSTLTLSGTAQVYGNSYVDTTVTIVDNISWADADDVIVGDLEAGANINISKMDAADGRIAKRKSGATPNTNCIRYDGSRQLDGTVLLGANDIFAVQAVTVANGAALGTYDALNAAFAYLNGIASPDTANPYAVTVNESMDIIDADTTLAMKASAAKVTLKSGTGGPFTLTRDSSVTGDLITVASGKLTIEGLVLDGGARSGTSGSLVKVSGANASLTLDSGATLTKNYAATGGGAYVDGGALTMNANSSIYGNSASSNGGGVYVASGGFTMNGGYIQGNVTTQGDGGGVYAAANGVLTLSGAAQVYDNMGRNIVSAQTGGVIVGDLSADGEKFVYISTQMDANGKIAARLPSTTSENLTRLRYDGGLDGTALLGADGVYAKRTVSVTNGAGTALGTYDTLNAAFAYLNGIESPDTAKPYTVTVHEDIPALSAQTIDMQSAAAELTLKGEDGKSITLTRGGAATGQLIAVNKGKLILKNITLDGNKTAAKTGSLIYVDGGALDMQSGAILKNNRVTDGGGIYINSGSATMNGGEIKGNVSEGSLGGGVYVYNNGSFTFNGGKIYENSSTGGGGVYSAGIFTMTDGRIYKNSAVSGGGARANQGTTTITGGEIAENTASLNGGGLTVFAAQIIVGGGVKISGNLIGSAPDNLYLWDTATIGIDGGGLSAGAAIGVGAEKPNREITGASAQDLRAFFFSDDANRALQRSTSTGTLYLSDAPLITANPRDITVSSGAEAVFSVGVTSDAETLQWQLSTDGGANFADIEGEEAAVLTISRAAYAMNGYRYRCEARKDGRAQTSSAATLNVNGAFYNVAVTGGTGSGSYEAGAQVNIAADAPLSGMKFDAWVAQGVTLADPKSANTSFTMPGNDVSVRASYAESAEVTGIDLPASSRLEQGEQARLSVKLSPEGAHPRGVIWNCDNPSVASVDDMGLLRALSPGTATVTAASRAHPSVKASCAVTVVKPSTAAGTGAQGARLKTMTIAAGGDADLKKLFGQYAWQSLDPDIASVDENGVLRGKREGEAALRGSFGVSRAKSVLIGDEIELRVRVVRRGYAVKKLSLSPEKVSIDRGERLMLTASVSPEKALDKALLWTTSDAAVAAVDDGGVVTGVGAGTAEITATASSGVTRSARITVSGAGTAPSAPSAQSLLLTPDARTQKVGETLTLTAAVSPANASLAGLVWQSSNAAVATVSNGAVTGVAAGEAVITAKLDALSASCRVTVQSEEAPENTVALSVNFLAIAAGKRFQLKELTGFMGTWSAADAKIATVTPNGRLKAKKAGETVLSFTVGKATEKNAKFMGKALLAGESVDIRLIVVPKGRAVTKLKLSGDVILAPGESGALLAKVSPEKAIHKDIFWKSADPSVARIASSGVMTGRVTAVAPGTARITATATSGVSKTITVTVSREVLEIVLTKAKARVKKDETLQLALKSHLPAALPAPKLSWTSSKESVATVDANGLVTARKKGKTVISATTENGITAKCQITVK